MTNPGSVFAIILIIAVGLIGVSLWTVWSRHLNLNAGFRRLANDLDGTFHRSSGVFDTRGPSARFVQDGVEVLVDLQSTGGDYRRYFTRMHITWPDDRLLCEIFPERLFRRLGKLFGTQDIEIGHQHFDDEYIIRGGSQALVRNLLSLQVQQAINRLREVSPVRDLYVLWSNGRLQVKVQGVLHEYEELKRFTQRGLELYEHAMATQADGIEFLDQSQPLVINEMICQICGDSITSDLVTCRNCKTPHHGDCWEYYGACSTYGCGQTKFSR